MSTPNLVRRGSKWYLRREIPKDVREFYPGNRTGDLWKSLRTSDRAEAQRRFHAEVATLDAEFEECRRKLARKAQDAAFGEDPRFADLRWDLYRLAAAQQISEAEPRSRSEALAIAQEVIDEYDYDLRHNIEAKTVEEGPEGESYEIDYTIPEHLVPVAKRLLREHLEAQKASALAKKRMLESPAPAEQAPADASSLTALVSLWIKERSPRPKTVLEMKKAVERFEAVNGPLSYDAITATHARQFKDALLSLDAKSATKTKQWNFIKILLNIAVDNDLLRDHPLNHVKLRLEDDSAQRSVFGRDDLLKVFQTARDHSPEWWLCRMGLYTGARLGELCQLDAADFISPDGIPSISITAEGGKSVKTRTSIRTIPLHQQLIDDGILSFIPQSGPVFGVKASVASKRLARLIDSAGFTGRGYTFHSLRHTFKTAARTVMAEEYHDRLTGHATASVGRGYGVYDIAKLRAEMDKVRYGIETSRTPSP